MVKLKKMKNMFIIKIEENCTLVWVFVLIVLLFGLIYLYRNATYSGLRIFCRKILITLLISLAFAVPLRLFLIGLDLRLYIVLVSGFNWLLFNLCYNCLYGNELLTLKQYIYGCVIATSLAGLFTCIVNYIGLDNIANYLAILIIPLLPLLQAGFLEFLFIIKFIRIIQGLYHYYADIISYNIILNMLPRGTGNRDIFKPERDINTNVSRVGQSQSSPNSPQSNVGGNIVQPSTSNPQGNVSGNTEQSSTSSYSANTTVTPRRNWGGRLISDLSQYSATQTGTTTPRYSPARESVSNYYQNTGRLPSINNLYRYNPNISYVPVPGNTRTGMALQSRFENLAPESSSQAQKRRADWESLSHDSVARRQRIVESSGQEKNDFFSRLQERPSHPHIPVEAESSLQAQQRAGERVETNSSLLPQHVIGGCFQGSEFITAKSYSNPEQGAYSLVHDNCKLGRDCVTLYSRSVYNTSVTRFNDNFPLIDINSWQGSFDSYVLFNDIGKRVKENLFTIIIGTDNKKYLINKLAFVDLLPVDSFAFRALFASTCSDGKPDHISMLKLRHRLTQLWYQGKTHSVIKNLKTSKFVLPGLEENLPKLDSDRTSPWVPTDDERAHHRSLTEQVKELDGWNRAKPSNRP